MKGIIINRKSVPQLSDHPEKITKVVLPSPTCIPYLFTRHIITKSNKSIVRPVEQNRIIILTTPGLLLIALLGANSNQNKTIPHDNANDAFIDCLLNYAVFIAFMIIYFADMVWFKKKSCDQLNTLARCLTAHWFPVQLHKFVLSQRSENQKDHQNV